VESQPGYGGRHETPGDPATRQRRLACRTVRGTAAFIGSTPRTQRGAEGCRRLRVRGSGYGRGRGTRHQAFRWESHGGVEGEEERGAGSQPGYGGRHETPGDPATRQRRLACRTVRGTAAFIGFNAEDAEDRRGLPASSGARPGMRLRPRHPPTGFQLGEPRRGGGRGGVWRGVAAGLRSPIHTLRALRPFSPPSPLKRCSEGC
jgi:hypothetical protein